MREPKKDSKRMLITRIICAVLALLMLGSIATYALIFLFGR
ncbi:MAG TPA: hypothetical protein PKN17_03735 [Bacillota bacterium]|nr:hypothetical protein [Bacillota bacterium]